MPPHEVTVAVERGDRSVVVALCPVDLTVLRVTKRRRWVRIEEKSKARMVVENGEGVVVVMPIGSDLARTCAFAYTCGVACGALSVANRLANPPGGPLRSQDRNKTPGRRVSGGNRPCASGRKSGVQMRWPTSVDPPCRRHPGQGD